MNASSSTAVGPSGVMGHSLQVIADVALRYGLDDIAQRTDATAARAARGTLTVAVVGQFKAGKSSLLNALMGIPLLPVRVLPATSVITVVANGPYTAGVVTYLSGTDQAITTDEVGPVRHRADPACRAPRLCQLRGLASGEELPAAGVPNHCRSRGGDRRHDRGMRAGDDGTRHLLRMDTDASTR